MHSNGTESVTFFGAQSSLGDTIFIWGARAVIWGGHDPRMPIVAGAKAILYLSFNLLARFSHHIASLMVQLFLL